MAQHVTIPTATTRLSAHLALPQQARGVVVIAHGPYEPHATEGNPKLEASLLRNGFAVLTVDLSFGIDSADHASESSRRHAIHVLAQRLVATTEWLRRNRATASLPVAYLGTGLAASAACAAAVARVDDAACIVSLDGRIDLVGHDLLARIRAPMLLLVSDSERELIEDTRMACAHLHDEHRLKLVARNEWVEVDAGAFEQVESQTGAWLNQHMGADVRSATSHAST